MKILQIINGYQFLVIIFIIFNLVQINIFAMDAGKLTNNVNEKNSEASKELQKKEETTSVGVLKALINVPVGVYELYDEEITIAAEQTSDEIHEDFHNGFTKLCEFLFGSEEPHASKLSNKSENQK